VQCNCSVYTCLSGEAIINDRQTQDLILKPSRVPLEILSVVGIAGRRRGRSSSPGRVNEFSLLHVVRTGSVVH
jgi:hypothetical protein